MDHPNSKGTTRMERGRYRQLRRHSYWNTANISCQSDQTKAATTAKEQIRTSRLKVIACSNTQLGRLSIQIRPLIISKSATEGQNPHTQQPIPIRPSTKPRHATKPSKIRDVNFTHGPSALTPLVAVA